MFIGLGIGYLNVYQDRYLDIQMLTVLGIGHSHVNQARHLGIRKINYCKQWVPVCKC